MIFITGGFGQVGLFLLERLLAEGRDVLVYDVQANPQDLELVCGRDAVGKVKVEIGDLSAPGHFLSLVDRYRPETIVHLASMIIPTTEVDAARTIQQNVISMVNVLDSARLFGVKRVLYASAPSVFGSPKWHGGSQVVARDDTAQIPDTFYGVSKSTNEHLARIYRARYGLDSIGFRLCQGYGPGKRRGRAYGYQMFDNLVDDKPISLAYGDDRVNWQYVEDIAEIFHRAVTMQYAGVEVYNTSGELMSMRKTAEIISELFPNVEITLQPGVADILWDYDDSRLKSDLGFQQPTSVREGFQKTVRVMREWRARLRQGE